MIPHLRGLLVLLAGAWMVVLGFPDWVGPQHPIRSAVVEGLTPTQRPLRIAQKWNLYAVGPNEVRRLRILADGELLYRSGDRHRAGSHVFHPLLRYRRVRPVVVNACQGKGKNSAYLMQHLVARARVLRPEASSVELLCTASPWPGLEPTATRRWTAHADQGWALQGP